VFAWSSVGSKHGTLTKPNNLERKVWIYGLVYSWYTLSLKSFLKGQNWKFWHETKARGFNDNSVFRKLCFKLYKCIVSSLWALMPWNTFARFMCMMNVRTFAIFIRPRLRAKYSYTLCTQSIPINPPPLHHKGEIISKVAFLFFMRLHNKGFWDFWSGNCMGVKTSKMGCFTFQIITSNHKTSFKEFFFKRWNITENLPNFTYWKSVFLDIICPVLTSPQGTSKNLVWRHEQYPIWSLEIVFGCKCMPNQKFIIFSHFPYK
jgi:hypothetical protein